MIQHSVPRFNNPTGVFDNDQYIVEILTTADAGGQAARTALLADINILFDNCGVPCPTLAEDANPCDPVSVPVAHL